MMNEPVGRRGGGGAEDRHGAILGAAAAATWRASVGQSGIDTPVVVACQRAI
jgi:hypothetical protein